MTDKNNGFGDHPENTPGNQGSSSYEAYGSQGNQPGADAGAGYPADSGYQQQGSYPAGGYPAGDAGYAGQYQENNNAALWGMILGIISLILVITIFVFWLGAILAIVALIVSIMGLRRAGKIVGPNRRKGMAITGLVTSILALLGGALLVLATVVGLSMFGDSVQGCEHLQDDQEAFADCIATNMEEQFQ